MFNYSVISVYYSCPSLANTRNPIHETNWFFCCHTSSLTFWLMSRTTMSVRDVNVLKASSISPTAVSGNKGGTQLNAAHDTSCEQEGGGVWKPLDCRTCLCPRPRSWVAVWRLPRQCLPGETLCTCPIRGGSGLKSTKEYSNRIHTVTLHAEESVKIVRLARMLGRWATRTSSPITASSLPLPEELMTRSHAYVRLQYAIIVSPITRIAINVQV